MWFDQKSIYALKYTKENKKASHRMGRNICRIFLNKDAIFKICGEFLQLYKETKERKIKLAKVLNRNFTPKDLQMAKKKKKTHKMLLRIISH